jgi:peroxiredoxin family protein
MNKEQTETEKYKKPLGSRAEEFIYQMAHKTELLEVENKRLQIVADNNLSNVIALLSERNKMESVALKACEMIADARCCPYASTMAEDCDEISDALGCDDCETQLGDEDCWFKYFSLDLDEIGDEQDED